MKKLLLTIVTVTTLLFMSSCGGDSEPSVNPLVGEWELDNITISDPPTGFSFELFNTEPSSTLLGETRYTIEFKDDMTYEREIRDARLFDNQGNEIVSDLDDDGEWEQDGNTIDLDQENADFADIPTRFELVEIDDETLTVTTTDSWFAWPAEIANDPVALDTLIVDGAIDNERFTALLIEYGEIVDATFTLEFDKN